MRTTSCLTLLAALAVPAFAQASCYSVYDAQNRLSFQTTVAPIDLSRPISEAMRGRFPGGYLVMIPDDADCREFRSSGAVQPRFDAVGLAPGSATPADQALQASPLLRGTRSSSLIDTGVLGAGDGDLATREAVRSGTSLNVKRAPRP